jgi:tetratricopeptide (TPR) repeat protein
LNYDNELREHLSGIERMLFALANRLARWLPFLRKDLDAAAQRYESLAKESYAAGDIVAMAANYERAIVRAPLDPSLLHRAGQMCYDSGSYDYAEDFFRRAWNEDYFDKVALKGLAFALHARSRTDEAVYFYFRYLDQVRDDYDVLLNLGALFQDTAQYEQAIQYTRRAAAANPLKAAPLHNLAVANFNLGRFEEAEENVKAAIALDRNAESSRLMGLILETEERPEEALSAYQDACNLDPSFSEACLDVARLYNKTGRTAAYLETALKAVQAFDSAGDTEGLGRAYWELGWAYYRSNNWEKSAEASRKALALNPSSAPARFNLGLALLLVGQGSDAMKEYQHAMRDSKVSDLKNDAIDDLVDALQSHPDLPVGREVLDMLVEAYGRFERTRAVRSRRVTA